MSSPPVLPTPKPCIDQPEPLSCWESNVADVRPGGRRSHPARHSHPPRIPDTEIGRRRHFEKPFRCVHRAYVSECIHGSYRILPIWRTRLEAGMDPCKRSPTRIGTVAGEIRKAP